MKDDTNHVDVTTPPRFLVCEGAETRALIDGPGDTQAHAVSVARKLQQETTLGITLWREAGRFPAPSQQQTDAPPPREPQTCAEAAARNPFKYGDVVRLKSEDRWMTVVCPSCLDVECGWFDSSGAFHCESFHIDTLTKAERDDELPF
ncbi:DUF2158 domain-containing protein [Stappia indica]|uniref:DUF2158 domain-containing protein n=1 Tax=Stappia indica TaxID=538381 RepID=A0A857C5W9_9HYPH|nr:DUF2158 domain-containing protein [Stappia indica]QGZ33952.1 DUF2158 domain-containing protein [Stappia indica]